MDSRGWLNLPRLHRMVIVAWVVCCAVFMAGMALRAEKAPDRTQDIYYIYLEGRNILDGVNPYARIAGSDMEHNEKYATYLPGFYLAAAATQAAGLRAYPVWLDFWRLVFLGFWAATGALLFAQVYGPDRRLAPAVLASALWLFNRWSLHVLLIAHTDFLAVFFLLLGAVLLARRPGWAWFAVGVSLSVKHIGILAVPLLVVAHWQSVPAERRRREMLRGALAGAAVPLLTSLPFLVADARTFVMSMLFSATRKPKAFEDIWALDAALDLEGIAARVPMLLLAAAATWLFARRQMGLHAALFTVMLAFVWFNSICFPQYMVWPIPFALLAVLAQERPAAGRGADA